MNKIILEDRLINFTVSVHKLTHEIDSSFFANKVREQLIRSSLSPALNYSEAQGAESQKDFIHKMRIALKELRESYVALRILDRSDLCRSEDLLKQILDECNQLISIFVSSIKTAEKRINGVNKNS